MITINKKKSDSPEVEAVKKKVREVSMKYAERHGWCGEVQEALVEADVLDGVSADRVLVRAEALVPMTLTFEIDVAEVPETEEDQRAALAKLFTNYLELGASGPLRYGEQQLGEFQVGAFTDVKFGGQVYDGFTVPTNMFARFASDVTKVRHLLTHRRPQGYALCGHLSVYWSDTSTKDVGRVCVRCQRQA